MPTSQQQIETRSGVTYATHDGVALAGDLYLPAGAGPFPALVAAHGGGSVAHNRQTLRFSAGNADNEEQIWEAAINGHARLRAFLQRTRYPRASNEQQPDDLCI